MCEGIHLFIAIFYTLHSRFFRLCCESYFGHSDTSYSATMACVYGDIHHDMSKNFRRLTTSYQDRPRVDVLTF